MLQDNSITKASVARLCGLFGKSRQAYYQKKDCMLQQHQQFMLILELVSAIRRDIPGLGTHKLYRIIKTPIRNNGITLGRDKLHLLLRENNLLVRRTRKTPKTTYSKHWMKKYPNLIREKRIERIEQVWVCDLTYICVGYDFHYLSLITDAYSKKIVGYHLHPYLTTEGCLEALTIALKNRSSQGRGLIHHSDRGCQYCSFEYVSTLKEAGIAISMTEHGDPYENAIAERVNGILKSEFHLNKLFRSPVEAQIAVQNSITNYNTLRPHMSCNYLTPQQAHETLEPLVKRWKN